MIKGIYSSSNGMPPMLVRMEVIANNLANINTNGFKKDAMFVQMMSDPGAAPANNAGELTTGLTVERRVDFGEGGFRRTDNPLDLAVQGDGYFVIETTQGERYTRNGNFSLSLDGTLVTQQGQSVIGDNGKIKFPDLQRIAKAQIAVTPQGEIMVDKDVIGKIRIVEFKDPAQLRKAGDAMFRVEPGNDPQMSEVEMPVIRQGFLEESNVDGIAEMIEMIEITRNFESNQKAIASQDATVEKVLEMGRF